jgi:hypothetical protein
LWWELREGKELGEREEVSERLGEKGESAHLVRKYKVQSKVKQEVKQESQRMTGEALKEEATMSLGSRCSAGTD